MIELDGEEAEPIKLKNGVQAAKQQVQSNAEVRIPKVGEEIEFYPLIARSSFTGKRAKTLEVIPVAQDEVQYYPAGVKVLIDFFQNGGCQREVRADECIPIIK